MIIFQVSGDPGLRWGPELQSRRQLAKQNLNSNEHEIGKCQSGEGRLMGHQSTLPFLDFLLFLWKEFITATKMYKKEKDGVGEERRESTKTKHQSYDNHNGLVRKEPGNYGISFIKRSQLLCDSSLRKDKSTQRGRRSGKVGVELSLKSTCY